MKEVAKMAASAPHHNRSEREPKRVTIRVQRGYTYDYYCCPSSSTYHYHHHYYTISTINTVETTININTAVRNQQWTPYRIPLLFPRLQNNANLRKVNPPSAKEPIICSTCGCPGNLIKAKTEISCIGLWSVPSRRSKGEERERDEKKEWRRDEKGT